MTAALSRPTCHKSAKAYSSNIMAPLSITKLTLNEPTINSSDTNPVAVSIEHGFCKNMWEKKINSKDGSTDFICPDPIYQVFESAAEIIKNIKRLWNITIDLPQAYFPFSTNFKSVRISLWRTI